MEREDEIENTARQFVNCRGYWMEQEKKIKYIYIYILKQSKL